MNTYHRQLDALGDPTRRAIFEYLALRASSVRDLASIFPISRPAVSQHLRVLKEADLVMDRAEGTRRIYQANPEALERLRSYFDQFWTRSLTAFKSVAEIPENKK